MRHSTSFAFGKVAACAIALGGLAAGCHKDGAVEESPAEAARQAVGLTEDHEGKEKTTAVTREVLVEKTTKVIDQKTGQVITTEKEVTPVTVEKQKTVDTDVNVDVGDTTNSVE